MIRFKPARNLPGHLSNFTVGFIHKYPRCYLGCATLFALFGYAFVLLFPILSLSGIVKIYQGLTTGSTIDWLNILLWLAISIITGFISYRYARFKPSAPAGLTLTEDNVPELFSTLEQIRTQFKRPSIHRIIITSDYELDIIKTPRWAIPVWSLNTLVIGLPVLQCMTVRQFECMLARRFGQFSKRTNLLTNWLYQLRAIWQQYRESYIRQKSLGTEPMKWFFSLYAPLYCSFSACAARRDELNADSYAMELYNDEVVREMITTDAVYRFYLKKRYWPAVHKIAELETKSSPTPHKKMAAAVHANLKGEKLHKLVDETFKATHEAHDPVPSLPKRIQNIGHDHPQMNDFEGPPAAVHYLGASMNGIIVVIDELWRKTSFDNRKKRQLQIHKQAMTTQTSSH